MMFIPLWMKSHTTFLRAKNLSLIPLCHTHMTALQLDHIQAELRSTGMNFQHEHVLPVTTASMPIGWLLVCKE